jgi:quercetin dioxygenase-like cupin family protein
MKIKDIPFTITDWSSIDAEHIPGEVAYAEQRIIEDGNVRVRQIEYTPGYRADHWCERGHVLYVLRGELVIELNDGRQFSMTAGNSFQVADGPPAHLVYTENGCTVFIMD